MEDEISTSKSEQRDLNKTTISTLVTEETRRILSGTSTEEVSQFCSNKVITSRYTWWNWAPKSLLMQFSRINNVYFLIISILTLMPFSPIMPWSLCGTFAAILIFTMFKELFEDLARHKQDGEVNSKRVLKFSFEFNAFVPIESQNISVGDIIKIHEHENFCADFLMLANSNDKGIAFVNTMNLDGETNLKEKYLTDIGLRISSEEDLRNFQVEITTDLPNASLVAWNCNIKYKGRQTPLSIKQLLLRGCLLKNTDWVYGIAVYTGPESKIVLNSKKAPTKVSNIQKTMNYVLLSVFFFLIGICILFASIGSQWLSANSSITYIDLPSNTAAALVLRVLTYWIGYSFLIPISLYVALEIIKLLLGNFIKNDLTMYYEPQDRTAMVRASDLIEELGQVSFIFSDKTGTLTCNEMEFRKCSINSVVYGSLKNKISEDQGIMNAVSNKTNKEHENVCMFAKSLVLCNSVFPVQHEGQELMYQASSPDELALVVAAKELGYELKERVDGSVYVDVQGSACSWEIVVEVPFNSDRKRMSIITKDPITKKYTLFTKGADTMMINLIKPKDAKEVQKQLNEFALEGLRTLMVAYRELRDEEFASWHSKWMQVVLGNSKEKDELLSILGAEIEVNLELIGTTAIEDKLQDGVPETIELLMQADIKLWVLTGDKEETAIEIAKSCNLFKPNMEIIEVFVHSRAEITEKLESLKLHYGVEDTMDFLQLETLKKSLRNPIGLVINGISLAYVLESDSLKKTFFQLGFLSNSCVCCRVSPSQKMLVVRLCRSFGPWISLSIGDGANDVSMIQEAHIGIGIAGKEGTQAVQASDFTFCQFRYLQPLLLVHGRYAYKRISFFILYYFYKNFLSVFTQLWFPFFNGYSGQLYFLEWLPSLYNLLYTSWTCLTFFTLERDISPKESLKYPNLYSAGQKGTEFNVKIFWKWILFAFLSSAWIYWLPNYALKNGFGARGHEPGLFWVSTVSFIMVLHVVNLKMLIVSGYWTFYSILSIFVSILLFYILTIMMNSVAVSEAFQPEFTLMFFKILASGKTWVVTILGSLIALIPDFLATVIGNIYFPSPSEKIVRMLKGQNKIYSE